jgi:uncharacterized protein
MNRLISLDVIRGFALCGILLVNMPALLADAGIDVTYSPQPEVIYTPVQQWLELLVAQRFFPIFSLLFGVGFGLMWCSGRARGLTAGQVRTALARRIAVLAALGAVHQLIHPGEALLPYALVAAVVLLPMTLLPRRTWTIPALWTLALVLLATALAVGGGYALVPGLFVLGFTAAAVGAPAAAQQRPLVVGVVAGCAALAAIPLLYAQTQLDPTELLGPVPAVAGVVLATAYVAGLLLLLRTPAAGVLTWFLAPLGRMALTNYLLATPMVLLLGQLGGAVGLVPGARGAWAALGWCLVILLMQLACSRWWLSRHAQGPLESLWRRITWGGRPHQAPVARPR